MRAGNLRNYVEVQQLVMVEDENLEWVESWLTFTSCWAEILPLIGREYWASRQVVSEVTGKIRMRYLAGIKPTMRVIDGVKTFNIEAVIDVENKHEEIVLLIKENL